MNIKAVLAVLCNDRRPRHFKSYEGLQRMDLQNNPDIEIGISLPMIDFRLGHHWVLRHSELYPFVIVTHEWIDSLRIEFPDVNIFSWGGQTPNRDDLLAFLFGAKPTSIFTDADWGITAQALGFKTSDDLSSTLS